MTELMYQIGELAQRSGVTTKTIRFYSDSGLLPPSGTTEAGYRLYTDADLAKLALIRSLREVDIDLARIKALLQEDLELEAMLRLQLETTELQLRQLQRQQTVLRLALAQPAPTMLNYVQRMHQLARWDSRERQQFLDDRMQQAFEDVPADEEWKATFWRHAVEDLPEIFSEDQLEAWLELGELVSDPDFIRSLNRIGRASWQHFRPDLDMQAFQQAMHNVYLEVSVAQEAQVTTWSSQGLVLVERYITLQRQALTWGDQPDFIQRLLAFIEANSDARATRYWELLARVRQQPLLPFAAAQQWLNHGLRWLIAQQAHAEISCDDNEIEHLKT